MGRNTDDAELELTFTDVYDAIQQVLHGYPDAAVAGWLIKAGYWPDTLGADTARLKVNACKRRDGDQQFKRAELLYLQWKTGRHYVWMYEGDVLNRERGAARDHSIEKKALQGQIPALKRELEEKERRLAALDRLNESVPEFPFKEGLDGRPVRFAKEETDGD